ncbi:MAG: tetratricopeptide repeat protein [Bacteroidota bacterium]
MKRIIALGFILHLFHSSGFSQKGQHLTDSLLTVLQNCRQDDGKMATLNALAYEFRNNNPDTSLYFSNQAILLSGKLNRDTLTADAYLNMGIASVSLGNYIAALKYLEDAIKLYDKVLASVSLAAGSKVLKQKAKAYSVLGNTWTSQGIYPQALKNYFVSLMIRQEINDKTGIASVYNNIATVYLEEGNFPESLKSNLAALKIREELNDKEGIAASYNNIGNVYDGMLNYEEALKMHFAALKIRKEIDDKNGIANSYSNIGGIYSAQGNYDPALTNILAAVKIRDEIGDQHGLATSYINIGNVYLKKNNYAEALKNYFTSLKIAEEIGDQLNIVFALTGIGNVYTVQRKYSDATDSYDKALMIAKEIGSVICIKEAYAGLAVLDSLQGNYKQGWQHYKMFVMYRDSLFNEENTKKAVQNQMQYEFDKKESDIKARQDKKDALTNEKIAREQLVRNFSMAGTFGIIALSGYMFYNFRKRKKLESLQALSNERLRISRELHDDMGSTLGSIAVYSDVARNRSLKNESPVEVLSKIGATSRELIEKMSDIVWSLNPDSENFEQMLNRMQAFAAMILTSRNISFEFKTDEQLKLLVLTSQQRKNIFLIFKESIYNIVKYAEANHVLVEIRKTNNKISMLIKDDGKGFDVGSFEDGRGDAYNGNGLKNIRTRADEISGNLLISSSAKDGTSVSLSISL